MRAPVRGDAAHSMNRDDFPAPKDGFVLTHFLVVADQDRSRDFYQRLFDGQVVVERDPVIIKVANSWLILNDGGGPTDKPTVTLTTPRSQPHQRLPQRPGRRHRQGLPGVVGTGAEFLTEPKDHGREIRAYVRDPDGHLIEVGQTTGMLA